MDVLVLNIVDERPPGEYTQEDGVEKIGGVPILELYRKALEAAAARGQVWGTWEQGDQLRVREATEEEARNQGP